MKNFLLLILFMFITCKSFAGVFYYGTGEAVNLEDKIRMEQSDLSILTGSATPSITSTDAERGSIYLNDQGYLFIKKDAGDTTNWARNLDTNSVWNDLSDVDVSSAEDNQIAIFDLSTEIWESATAPYVHKVMGTRLCTGATLSINGGDTATFDMTSGQGWVVDNTTDIYNPVITNVTINAASSVAVTNIATQEVTYLMMDSTGAIIQIADPPTSAQKRSNIYLGALIHPDNASISFVNNNNLNVPFDITAALSDFAYAYGPFNIGTGNAFTADGSNLKLDKTAGQVFQFGSNYKLDSKNPHKVTVASCNQCEFRYTWRDSGGNWVASSSAVTDIVPNLFDDGTGTATVPNGVVNTNNWSTQRIFLGPTFILIQYGQTEYNTSTDAKNDVNTESFIISDNAEGLLPIGALIVRGGTSDLSSDGIFLRIVGNAAGGSTTVDQNNWTLAEINHSGNPNNITGCNTVYVADASGGAVTATLPDSASDNDGCQNRFILDENSNTLTVTTSGGSQEIGSATSQVISQSGKGMMVISHFNDAKYLIAQDSRFLEGTIQNAVQVWDIPSSAWIERGNITGSATMLDVTGTASASAFETQNGLYTNGNKTLVHTIANNRIVMGAGACANCNSVSGSVVIGDLAMANETSDGNIVAIGMRAMGSAGISYEGSVAIGYNSMYAGGSRNSVCIGAYSCTRLDYLTISNASFGYGSMQNADDASRNSIFGTSAGGGLDDGDDNSQFGYYSGQAQDVTGSIYMGAYSGMYETDDYSLIIDSLNRSNEADSRAFAPIYGVVATATESQTLVFNGGVTIAGTASITEDATFTKRVSIGSTISLVAAQMINDADYVLAISGNEVYKMDTPTGGTGTATVALTYDIEFGETISSGDLLKISSEGKALKLDDGYYFLNVENTETFDSSNVLYVTSVSIPDTSKIVVFYSDQGNSSYGTAVVGTISGNSITYGTPNVYESGAVYFQSAVYDEASGKVVVFYYDSDNGGYGTAAVGTISGTSISFGTPVVFRSVNVQETSAAYHEGLGKIVVFSRNNGSTVVAEVGTVSGTSISFGSETAITAATEYLAVAYDSKEERILFVYRNASGYGASRVASVSGTTVSLLGSETTFNAISAADHAATYVPAWEQVMIAYRDATALKGSAVVGSVSGSTVSYGDVVYYESGEAYDIAISTGLDGSGLIAYRDVNNGSDGTVIRGRIVSGNISFEDAVPVALATGYTNTIVYNETANKIVHSYRNGSLSKGESTVLTVGDAPLFMGIAQEAGTSGQTKKMTLLGSTSTAHSGKTPGQKAYIQSDGTLGDVVKYNPVGRYISATELHLVP